MEKCFTNITDDLTDFILSQKMFFVGTAPNTEDKVHISPKGYDTLKIINENKILYLDFFGSENDTARHLNQSRKITLMWYSFDSEQCILRAFGNGKVISKGTDDFNRLLKQHFNTYNEKETRQIFEIKIHKLVTTCEVGVPIMKYEKDRDTLHKAAEVMFIKNPAGKLLSKIFDFTNSKKIK
ncbi:pyridoxamine 5'-phosphate oxidase family protein [Clostridium beijerinckii]|uniref:pyridoxamine 5'-phosphate oxidase family protein n=1 Tax=Clostridium beijerinckii TaxID=1520 RepID=UPI00098C4577|nr:pyridoxamine 5'-phosphate oxidase family protein [Clostridium beijerinckii]NRT80016.1 hypothetical protein [Clostridium beijerinckii]OOM48831.1 hypothetical protein CBEIJ_18830 [Clostridium beijerinckii]